MRRRLSFSLRWWLPIFVVATFVLLLLASAFWRDWQQSSAAEVVARELVMHRMADEQHRIEQLLRAREVGQVAEEIAQLGSVPEVVSLTLVDEQGQVLSSNQIFLVGRSMRDALPEFDASRLLLAQRNRRLTIDLDATREHLLAYQPISLAALPGQIRSIPQGGLLLKYDLASTRGKARREVIISTLAEIAFAILVMAVVTLILRRWLSRPLEHLQEAVSRISRGDFATKVEISGRGELAELGVAIGRMQADLGAAATERDRNLAALRVSEQRFRTIFEAEPECVKVVGPNGDLLEMNAAGLSILEAGSLDEVKSRGLGAFILPEYRAAFGALHKSAMGGSAGLLEFEVTGLRGTRRWLETHAAPLPDADGCVTMMLGITRDITTRKRAEEQLRLSEENLAITLQSIGDAVIATNAAGLITRMNPTAERLTGWLLADAAGRPLADVFHIVNAHTRAVAINPLRLVMEHGDVVGLANHTVLLARDGREYQISDSAAPIRDQADQIVGVVLVFSDVTERYQVEAALRESDQRFRDLVDSTDGIVWQADASTFVFNYISTNAERLLGYPAEDWLHPGFWVGHIYPPDRDQAVQYCAACTGRFEDHEFEYRFLAQDGRVIWLRDIVKVIEEGGKPRWLRGLMVDVTAQKQTEEALQSSLREKEALLKEVHHRVKNNLQVITSLLRLEGARVEQASTRSVLTDMQGRIRSMALLHESLYRSGTFASVDLGAYLTQLSSQAFRTFVASSGSIRLQLDLASVQVEMDQALPCGLLVNELVSNCLKHGFPDGRDGEVQVELHVVDGGPQVRLRVSDTGVGLPDDFETRRGHSLGLQLVSDLVGQLQGTLVIGPGSAAVFTITFTAGEPRTSTTFA